MRRLDAQKKINAPKAVWIGGKRCSPIDIEASIAAAIEVIEDFNTLSKKEDDIFYADFSIGVRRRRKHTPNGSLTLRTS